MKIIVLVKEVPDTYGERVIDVETGLADRAASESVIDEIGERAIEFAVSYAEAHDGTEVILLAVGPASVPITLRKGLAMGATRAIHVLDDALQGADLTLTAAVLASAIRTAGFDLVIAGDLSTDGTGGVIPAMVAELLGVAHATNLSSVEIVDGEVRGERSSDAGTVQLVAVFPAVVSITDRLPDPRFPNFKGILAAKKKALDTVSLSDLGVDAAAEVPRSIVLTVTKKPERGAGIKILDDGNGGTAIAEFLTENRLV